MSRDGSRRVIFAVGGVAALVWLVAGLLLSGLASFYGHATGSAALAPLLIAVAGIAALVAATRAAGREDHSHAVSFVLLAGFCFVVWLIVVAALTP
jgi:hypothetical protein